MADHKAGGKQSLYCLEYTSIYQSILLTELVRRKVPIWLESATQIHLSLGLQRGKSDKLDSYRIAEYAYTYRKKAKLWQPHREAIEQLKQLRSLRQRLLSVQQILTRGPNELKGFSKKSIANNVLDHCQTSILAIKGDLARVEESILAVITGDERLHNLYRWLTSVLGIGKVLATEMIITTNEFKNFSSPKKFACYCGIAPFTHTSGTSVRGKTRTSHFANMALKRTLHLAAMSSTQYVPELKKYYKRRVAEGKSKMCVINAIRNKLLHRILAVVKRGTPYILNYPEINLAKS